MAVFSRLLPCLASAYGLQTILAAIFVPQQNEKYYDLGGALGFLSTTAVSLYYPALKAKFITRVPGAIFPPLTSFAPRQILLSAALALWSARLGTFLAHRAIKAGGDSRFDEIKTKPLTFTYFWIGQVNALPASVHPALTRRDYAAVALFVGAFLFEIVADRQKTNWRAQKERKLHDEKFITSGLWSISRHPKCVLYLHHTQIYIDFECKF
ncbi:hypothetical protein H0H81_005985 [Sphagnurus paluster]|uniref:DUF1295-domain-containing protein n=1 Tax=Sphagnurus paluster TaxID=117069 RepID=A0A9P7KM33_9AGAR|nr:hypothetical protein H0H81_005985 [Sphagnurus paluster]